MKRALLAAAVLASACAAPKPCTRTLCVTKLDGTLDQSGWSGAVRSTSESPKPSVVSDTEVSVAFGSVEFRNGRTKLTAGEGAAFKFTVSTRAVAAIEVTAGAVTVAPESGAPVTVAPGAPYALPKPR